MLVWQTLQSANYGKRWYSDAEQASMQAIFSAVTF